MSDHSSSTTVLIHLSDIHFHGAHDDGPLDRDSDIRHQLELDLRQNVLPSTGSATAILVTGDIACRAAASEYETAGEWLRRLCEVVECPWPNVWTVPGNHDVDRTVVRESAGLQAIQKNIRTAPVERIQQRLEAHLRDRLLGPDLFAPIQNYCVFAGPLGCAVSASCPYWEHDLELGRGYILRMRGVTSTLVSGPEDDTTERCQVLGQFQVLAPEESGVARLVMSHHPPSWLRDQIEVRDSLGARVQIQLFGHQHDQRVELIDNRCVCMCAGAFHPPRDEISWEPRYNVLSVNVANDEGGGVLELSVYPRLWSRRGLCFQADFGDDGSDRRDFKLPVPGRASREQVVLSARAGESAVPNAVRGLSQASQTETGVDPYRRLQYRFLTLPLGLQIQIAQDLGLFREEDRGIIDPELLRRVLTRAHEAGIIGGLWDAVESRHADGRASPNPFNDRHNEGDSDE